MRRSISQWFARGRRSGPFSSRRLTHCPLPLSHQVRYESRKRLAEERPRVRGQFVKRTDVSASEA